MRDDTRDEDRLRLIIHLSELIAKRIEGLSLATFQISEDEIDLAAYRLGHIGENANKLSPGLKTRHPEIEWSAIAGFRNVMFHSYLGLEPDHMWAAITNSLPVLVAVAKVELNRIQQ